MRADKQRDRPGGDSLENAFREMFAERSETVRLTTAPYAAVRRRILDARRKRRLRIGSAGMAFAVAAAGIGVWAAGSRGAGHEAVSPAYQGVTEPAAVVYADGRTPVPDGPLRDAALKWLSARYRGNLTGLTVVTTFDQAVQTGADAKAAGHDTGAAVVDWRTGDVLALGGTWDRPLQLADIMKPIVLAAAFESGHYTPQSTEPLDTQKHPLSWPPGASVPMSYYNGTSQRYWPPESSTTSIEDVDVTLTQAAESGANGPFAQLGLGPDMSLPAILDVAARMGLPKDTKNLLRVPSLVLGVAEATPLTMAGVYATIADGGLHQDPVLVGKVLGKAGTTVWTPTRSTTRVLSQNTAQQLSEVLHAALVGGTTGAAAQARSLARSGTWAMAGASDSAMSAWFDGADGDYVIAVGLSRVNSLGDPAPLSGDHSRSGPGVGSSLAGPVWAGLVQTLRTHG
jgi:membrane peptidoglycan carboxypeptidase